MLSHFLFESSVRGDQTAVVTRVAATSWSELGLQTQAIFDQQSSLQNRRIGLSFRALAKSYAALAALERLKCDVFLLDGSLDRERALDYCKKFRLGAFLVPTDDKTSVDICELKDEAEASGPGSITILTSGSTGAPKAARHTWEGIARPIRRMSDGTFPVWLLTYRPQLYAGLQVSLQCLADHGTLVIPDSDMEPRGIVELMVRTGVQYISATPSFWRRLLMFSDGEHLRKVPLRQITLGGEIVDQAVLSKLERVYPAARLVHIYATTELGRCFSVGDGLAGFPARYLDGPLPDGVELKVEDGELLVRSSNAMQMYDPLSAVPSPTSDWFFTGDLVDIRGERVIFSGRKSDMINVAGSKVYPVEVERVILAVPGVADARVYGKASSIAGELVVCDVVAESNVDPKTLREQILSACRAKLTSPQLPRLIKFVDKIELSQAGKTLRSKSA
jgi:Acyl-CoA synthetases (AMP-forming)/AMP-acid ligases II